MDLDPAISVLTGETCEWDDYVLRHPEARNYHQAVWKTAIEESFSHDAHYLMARRSDHVVGVLPLVEVKSLLFGKMLVSLPFVNYGGLLADDRSAEQALVEAACGLAVAQGAGYLELRHRSAHGLGLRAKQHKVTMLLKLTPTQDAQWNALDPKVRNQIRKAQKLGLWTSVGGVELADVFYRIFSRNMRDLGTPVYSIRFFRTLLSRLGSTCRVIVTNHGGRAVAAGILTAFKGTLEMPWASSLRRYRGLCGNMLMYWDALRYGIQYGSSEFDFGRSTPGTTTYKFKEQWGAAPVPLHWEYWTATEGPLPDLAPANPKYRWAIRVWSHLPLAVTNRLGPVIARAIP